MTDFLLLDAMLLLLVTITAIGVIEVRSLFGSIVLAAIYSLLMAAVWQNMDAMDVAFTEAAVGAGISTILLIGTIVHVGRREKPRKQRVHLPALLIVCCTGGALIYGTFDMPRFGDPDAPIHRHRVPLILAQEVGKVPGAPAPTAIRNPRDSAVSGAHAAQGDGHDAHAHPVDDFGGHVPNTVTSLLAAYRSYDTMYETAVIFIAGMSMVLLLRRRGDTQRLQKGRG